MKKRFFGKRSGHDLLYPDEILVDSVSVLGSLSSEGKLERPIEKIFSTAFLVFIFVGVLYLAAQAASLQIKEGREHFAKSQENRFLNRPVLAPRGVIYDYKGRALVENRPSFGMILEKGEFLQGDADLADLLGKLTIILGKPKEYFYNLGFPDDYNAHKLPRYLTLAVGLDPDQILSIAPQVYQIRGVQIFEEYQRVYKNPYAFSHLLGFIGKVSEEDLYQNDDLSIYDTIGKSGIELEYDYLLRGKVGKKIVEINADGEESRFKLVERPEAGEDLTLTIDGELQRITYELVDGYIRERRGVSAVFLDPRDGAVRALLSYPGFNSNSFGNSLSQKEFQTILKNPLKPLFGRAISGEFPPGSTFKLLVGAAVLAEGIIDPHKTIYDPGFIEVPNPYKPGEVSRFVDWRPNPQPRSVNFYNAIAQSANVYFYSVGGGFKDQKGIGILEIKRYAQNFGLGNILGIDIPGEKPGLLPDPEWKLTAEPKDPVWRVGDTYNVSIGQGGVKTTPLQMAAVTAALGNGGKVYRPYVASTKKPEVLHEDIVSKEVLEHVLKAMKETSQSGTAKLLKNLPVEVATKTGTAESGSGQTHSWLVGFAPAENPEIAFAVMVEHAGEGTGAIAITNEILKWYFGHVYISY